MKTTTTSLVIFLCLSFGAGQGSAEDCGCGCGPNSEVDLMVYTSSLGSGSSCDEADEFLNNEFVAELFDNSDCLGEPIQRKNFNMTHGNSYPSFMIKIDDYNLWSARVSGDNVVEDCTGGFIPKLFGSSSIRVDVRMQSFSSSSELSWYITAEDQYSSDWYAYVIVLDEPSNKDCELSGSFCDSFCTHFPTSDNTYYPCLCNSADGGYGNNKGLPDNSVLGYETVNKIRFYTSTVYFHSYGTQLCEANVDINLWYNSGNGGSFYSPTIPCFNVSSPSTDIYDYYDYYDDYYNSVNEFDEENFSEDENAIIYGDNISFIQDHLIFISCMASKEDGSQSWIFFEKTLVTSYYSKIPKGFCECIHNENEGNEYATTESIKNCYGKSVSVSEAARSYGRPVRPYGPSLGHPREAPVRKQQMRPNKEVVFSNEKKKPNKTKRY